MSYKTLRDLRDKERKNRKNTKPNNHTNNNSDWIAPFAVFTVIAYLIYNSPLMAPFASSNCIRDTTNKLEWQNDWHKISEWFGFVEECTKNVQKSHDKTRTFGDHTTDNHRSPLFIENTRCVTTAYALINYLCNSDEIARSRNSTFYVLKHLSDNGQLNIDGNINEFVLDYFIQILTELKPSKQSIFRLYIDQNFDKDHLGHVWVLQTMPNNTFHWYQSFIGKYTLRTWMEKGNNSFLTKPQLLAKMELIRNIVTTKQWTEQSNEAYLTLFDVDYSHMIGKTISPSIFGKGSVFDNTIQFDWHLECQIV